MVGLGFIYGMSVDHSLRIALWRPVYRSYLSLATGHGDVHETASVCDSLLGAALGGLLLLLGLNLKACLVSGLSLLLFHMPKLYSEVALDTRCLRRGLRCSYLGGLRLDLTGTSERTVNLTHVGELWVVMELLGCR